MTICLAINCKNVEKDRETPSILFAADTQESGGNLKRQITKLQIMRARGKWSLKNRKSKGWQIAAAFAGDSLVADEALERIALLLYENLPPEEKNPAIMLREYRRKIGDIAYDTFQKHSARARKMKIYDETDFELFLGMADEESTLLDTTYEGKTRFIEDFGVIGSGGQSGGELLLREFFLKGKQRGEGSDLNEDSAASLAGLIISVVGHVDMYVSGEPDMYFCHDRRVEVYRQDKYRKILDGSESKWNLMRRVWQKMQEDNTFESKLKRVLAK